MPADFPIFVKNLSGKTFVVRCEPNDTIEKLKVLASEEMGIPPDFFHLTFIGRRLDPERTVDSYQIQKESTLYVESKLRGD